MSSKQGCIINSPILSVLGQFSQYCFIIIMVVQFVNGNSHQFPFDGH